MQTVLTICNIIASVIGFLYAYRVIFGIVGLVKTKRWRPAEALHKYAVVVAARNEAAVIGNLLDSIASQDYPRELLTVFVVADNCTDNTAEISRRHGAICYERSDTVNRTKGFALQFLFEQIRADYGIDAFEAYFLFDADNLLKSDYISRMNDAFDGGEEAVLSYRATKNLGDGWLSASYALHWLRTCRLEHCGRSFLDISSRSQGTGFLFANRFVRDGWNYTSLTEDRAISSHLVANGVTISYQHDAVFYDEQPTQLRIALRQRLRWAKGNLQAFTETCAALLRGIFKQKRFANRVSCYDILTFNFPSSVVTVPIKLLEAALIVALCVTSGNLSAEWLALAGKVCQILIFEHFGVIPLGLLLFFLERKRLPRLKWYQYIWYSIMFATFGIIGDIVMLLAVFKKVKWDPIPHNADIHIEELETAAAEAEPSARPDKEHEERDEDETPEETGEAEKELLHR